jgi:hypothetical protein
MKEGRKIKEKEDEERKRRRKVKKERKAKERTRDVSDNLEACSVMAAMMRGWLCPWMEGRKGRKGKRKKGVEDGR